MEKWIRVIGCGVRGRTEQAVEFLFDELRGLAPQHDPGTATLGDLGYPGWQRAEEWAEEADMLVLTRADAPEKKYLLAQVRQAVETTLSQLWHQFLDRVFSRSWRGLWNTVQLKVIYYNLRHVGILPV